MLAYSHYKLAIRHFAHLPNHIVPALDPFAIRAAKVLLRERHSPVAPDTHIHTESAAHVISQRPVTSVRQAPDRRTANRREFEQLNTSASLENKRSRRMIPVRIALQFLWHPNQVQMLAV